jgi:putative acetyltransferase
VLDQAESLAAARDYLVSAGVADRTELAAGSFRTEVPDGDLHLLSQVMHNWDDENVRRIAGNCVRDVADARARRPSRAMPEVEISIDDPRASDVRGLVERHLEFARWYKPPWDIHALDVAGLLDPAVTLFSCRAGGELLAVGALRRLDRHHAELKSMHTAEAARGRGIGRAMIVYLIADARDRGFRRISLKTGSQSAFAPARSLYASTGFTPCEPFGDYRPSRHSTFMTLSLDCLDPAV